MKGVELFFICLNVIEVVILHFYIAHRIHVIKETEGHDL